MKKPFLLGVLIALVMVVHFAKAEQSITITKINGVSVPPDQVFVGEDPFDIEWSAMDTDCNDGVLWLQVYVDNVVQPGSGSGFSGVVTLDPNLFPNKNCLNSIQIKAEFNAPTLCIIPHNIYSEPRQVWISTYKECTGTHDCNMSTVGGPVDPVDVATGKMYHEMIDLIIDGPLPIKFIRRYNNQSTYDGALGYGWQHNYLMKLESGGTNRKAFMDQQGRKIYFSRLPQGGWDENRIEHLVLAQPGTPPWQVSDKHKMKYNFDSSGQLQTIVDRNGNTITLGYTGSDLTSITDDFGRGITLTYDLNNRIQTISAGGRTATYTYSAGNLERADYSDDSFVTYDYDDTSDAHNMTAARDSYGYLIEGHSYYPSDKVQQTQADGGNYLHSLTYDSPTQTTVTNSRSVNTVYTHDSFNGLVTSSSGPGCTSCGGGINATLEYDRLLNLRRLTDAENIVTEMDYDGKGNVLTRTEVVGTPKERTWTFTYHSTFNFPTTITIPSVGACSNPNKIIAYTYNGTKGDRLTEQITGCNGNTPFTYTTTYTYDSHGQVETIDGPRTDVSDLTTFDYYADDDADVNRRARLQRVTNALEHQTTYSGYDLFGNVGSIIDANTVETTYLYNFKDLVTEARIKGSTSEEDIITENHYDLVGNLDYIRLPNCVETGPSCTFSLDYVYDTVNRLKEIHDSIGNKIIYTYDTEGNQTREEYKDVSDVVQRFTNYAYDNYNRLEYIYFNDIVPENPGSIFYKYSYYDDGTLESEQDPEGHVTTLVHDDLKRLQTLTQTVGVDTLTTTYGYDIQDNLASIEDPEGLDTTYGNSDMGWQLSVTSPDTGTTNHSYDPADNLKSTTNAKGITINRTHDALNRLGTVSYPDSSLNVTYSYDSPSVSFGIGRRTGMTDPSGTTVYHYERRGLLKIEEKTIDSTTYTTQYNFDKTGNLKQILYPTDNASTRQGQADFSYDDEDRISGIIAKVNGATTTVVSSLSYKPFGPHNQITFGNGLVDTRTYGTRYQLGTWTLGSLLNYTHIFDDDLNLTSRADNLDSANNRTFGYDEIHRLMQAAGPWGSGTACTGSVTYTYDKNGNRKCKGLSTPATTYTYIAGTNRLDSTSGGEIATYTYDNNGNTTGDGTHTYEYNETDRLATVDSGATASYTYDGDGRRVIKTASDETTYFFYDPRGLLIAETIAESNKGKDYLYLYDAPIARIDWTLEESLGNVLIVDKISPNVHLDWTAYPGDGNEYIIRRKQVVDPADKTFDGSSVIATVNDPTQTYDDPVLNDSNRYDYRVYRKALSEELSFYHTDHLGTPIALSDGSASFVWRAETRPFGGLHNVSAEIAMNNLRLPGQYFEGESGLHQNWYRDYDPEIGRYREADPLGLFGGLNLYTYVVNNPIAWLDVLGLYRKGDVIYRKDPNNQSSGDVTFIWYDPTPNQDGNGDEWIITFGNPENCPQTCSGKAQITLINSEQDPYKGWTITGDWKPGWWKRASDAKYQRRWNEWQIDNPTWTPPGVYPSFQCYNLVNHMTGHRDILGFSNPFDYYGPRNLSWWKEKTNAK